MKWVPSSRCCQPNCPMTLCTPAGGGLMLCWAHALAMGLPVDLDSQVEQDTPSVSADRDRNPVQR